MKKNLGMREAEWKKWTKSQQKFLKEANKNKEKKTRR